MGALTTQNIVDTGTKPNFALNTPTTSDTAEIDNGKSTFVVYKNTGTQKTITVVIPGNTFFGTATVDNVLTLPATTGELWIPLRRDYDDGTGRATITSSPDVTGVTVAVVRMS